MNFMVFPSIAASDTIRLSHTGHMNGGALMTGKLSGKLLAAIVGVTIVVVVATVVVAVLLANRPVTIAKSFAKCGQEGNEVKVAGHVDDVFEVPFVDMSVYRFVDDTASVWVVSKHPAPQQGREMVVWGSLGESAVFGKRCMGFIDNETVCSAAAKLIGAMAGECVLFEDRRE